MTLSKPIWCKRMNWVTFLVQYIVQHKKLIDTSGLFHCRGQKIKWVSNKYHSEITWALDACET